MSDLRLLTRFLGLATWLVLATETGASELERLPNFALENWTGEEISLDGSAAIVVFTYAKCDFACPLITYYLKGLDESLESPADLRYVHISVNPQADTAAEILKHFDRFDINPRSDPRWIFLNGPHESIFSLLEKHDITVARTEVEGGTILEHTIRVDVLNRQQEVVATFPTYVWDRKEMEDAIRTALATTSEH